MSLMLSDRVNRIESSATLSINARANELKTQGIDIINLSVGEPDFDTPEFIKKAAYQAAQEGFTKYSPVEGYADLKKAVIEKFRRENNLSYEMNEIIVSAGAKFSFFALFQALFDAGDEVIIPAPYWVSYPDMALLAEAKPVIIYTSLENNYKITAQQLEAAITPKTRLLILNSPSNPTGMAYTEQELKELAHVLLQHPQVLLASDDIYEHILWSVKKFINILNVCPQLKERTLVINGVSKAYAMTGWRIGYCAGPKPIIAGMSKIQSQSTSSPCSIAQKAAVAALNGDQSCIAMMREAYKKRHDLMLAGLTTIQGAHCKAADGTFYLFPDMKGVIQRLGLKDDIELAKKILDEAHVATVPGTPFGGPGAIRFSTAISEKTLQEALNRLKKIM